LRVVAVDIRNRPPTPRRGPQAPTRHDLDLRDDRHD
jgi:hypothetical protein